MAPQTTQTIPWEYLFAWEAAVIGITLTASLILLGIWRRGYPAIDDTTGEKTTRQDEGVKWMFWACTLWCGTAIAAAVGIWKFHRLPDSIWIVFVKVVLSLTNSLFFVLATANLDAVKAEAGFLKKTLEWIQARSLWILAFLIGTAIILCRVPKSELLQEKLCQGFDALVDVLTILLIGWGFFKSFQKRGFPIVAWFSVVVFLIFTVAELGDFFNAMNPESLFARYKLLGIALNVGTGGMVALLFIALTFSWVHEKLEDHINVNLDVLPKAVLRDISNRKGAGT